MLRNSSVFVSLTILVLTTASAFCGETWEKYRPDDGGFEISFPTKPTIKEPTPKDNLHMAAVQQTKNGEPSFICRWKLRDKPFENKDVERTYLKGQQFGMALPIKGKIVEESEITSGDFLGRDFTIQAEKLVIRARSYVSGQRIVTIMVIGNDRNAVSSDDAKKFLESFREAK